MVYFLQLGWRPLRHRLLYTLLLVLTTARNDSLYSATIESPDPQIHMLSLHKDTILLVCMHLNTPDVFTMRIVSRSMHTLLLLRNTREITTWNRDKYVDMYAATIPSINRYIMQSGRAYNPDFMARIAPILEAQVGPARSDTSTTFPNASIVKVACKRSKQGYSLCMYAYIYRGKIIYAVTYWRLFVDLMIYSVTVDNVPLADAIMMIIEQLFISSWEILSLNRTARDEAHKRYPKWVRDMVDCRPLLESEDFLRFIIELSR